MALEREFPRPLPKNREAEQVVLGAALLEPETVLPILLNYLSPEHFYWQQHQVIYRAILELAEKGRAPDLITVADRLEELQLLQGVGGRVYLSELVGSVTTTTSVEYYAEIVRKKATLRALIEAGKAVSELGYSEEEELEELLDRAEESIFSISRLGTRPGYHLISDFIHEHISNLERLHRDPDKHTVTGLSTGFKKFDEMTGGLQPSDLIIIAGRPSMGKSSLAVSIARNAALRDGKGVGLFSLEMTKEQLLERLICGEAKINLHQLRSGYLPAEKWRDIVVAAGKLAKSRIVIDDTPGISVMELKARARRMKAEYDIDLLFVDYLQLVESGTKTDVREQEISHIARSLKALARELSIPVVACSQLSRAVERREAHRPRLSDLRECVTSDTRVIDSQTGNLVEVCRARPGMSVIALGKDQRLRPALVLDVIPKGVNRVYRLRTQTGREIRATANHPFFTEQGWRPLRELAPGTLIATARSVSLPGEHRDPELCRLLGYLTGDGTYLRHREVGFANSDPTLIQDVITIAQEHFDVTVSRRPHFSSQQLTFVKKNPDGYGQPYGNPLRNWLGELGVLGERYDRKSVPDWVLTADNRGIAEYLSGLFATDGSLVQRPGCYWDVKLTTTSWRLAQDVRYLLTRLGLVSALTAGYQGVKATCPLYTVYLSRSEENLTRFAKLIPLHAKKAELAHQLAASPRCRRTNSGLEALPPLVSLLINEQRKRLGLSHAALGYRAVGKRISRSRAQEIAQRLGDLQLQNWAKSDILWERVLSIVPEGEEPVWDLVVAGAHNFVANGIVVHNSGEIEQTADVVVFIYRESYYDEEEGGEKADVNPTEIIIGKQRNGPTGSFKLSFHRSYASFYEFTSQTPQF
ncbi:MAG: replicative DNA helicase [Candidatus Acetothermia bacterium]|jgi:replicative DNA helicase|nr:replicative DNA helicase [Candidatus Acetothermia bacterium]MDH7505663.1 replicative DNA helicase [Candidatus Acetothermia bacterium]